MVSQEFMNILRKQLHHNDPTTSSSVTPSGSEEEPSNMQEDEGGIVIKEEVEDYVDCEESSVGIMTPSVNLKIEEEEENCSDEWKPFLSQARVKSEPSSREASPLRQDSRGNENVTSFKPLESHQQYEREEKTPNNPSNKRVIKKKAIFDPSDTSSSSHKNRRKKAPHKVKNEVCNSGTKDCKECPELLSKRTRDKMSSSCKYCGKHVKQKYYMRLHYMKHTGETPHKCSYCKKAYRTRWRLTQHLRTHTNSQPYHCPYCNYRGNRSDYITSHINRRHYKELKQALQKDKKEGMADSKE